MIRRSVAKEILAALPPGLRKEIDVTASRFASGNQTADGLREIKKCQEKAVYKDNEATSSASTRLRPIHLIGQCGFEAIEVDGYNC
jgi:hypothetical protein